MQFLSNDLPATKNNQTNISSGSSHTKKSRHILHIAKRRIIPMTEMKKSIESASVPKHWIGSLPPDIITNFDISQRGNITNEVDKIFRDFSIGVSNLSFGSFNTHVDIQKQITDVTNYCDRLKQNLENILQCNDISVSFVNAGKYKHCFRIKYGDYSYALSVFKSQSDSIPKQNHGPLIEPQNSFMVYKHMSHGRFARPFMVRMAGTEMSSGAYILSKFIEYTHAIKKKRGNFITAHDFLTSSDIQKNNFNTINGIIIDVGDFKYNKKYIHDKKTHHLWQNIAQILDEFDLQSALAYSVHTKLYEIYGETPELLSDTNLWPKILENFTTQEQVFANKTLRLLRRLQINWEHVQNSLQYTEIKKILHNDFVDFFNFRMFNKDFPKKYYLGTWPAFYPDIIAEIIGINNVPPISDLIEQTTQHSKKVDIRKDEPRHQYRLHWNKYYTESEILDAMQKYPRLDWSIVLSDFAPKKQSIIQKLKNFVKCR